MAYRFSPTENFEDGVRRIFAEQAQRVRSEIAGGYPDATAVHAARKGLKRLRALLRLVRPALAEDVWRRNNNMLRDAGRLMSGVRDRHVMLQTVLSLEAAVKVGSPDAVALAALRDRLTAPTGEAAGASEDFAQDVEVADGLVGSVAAAMAQAPLAGEGFELVRPGLVATYRRGRAAMAKARRTGSNEDVHDWRKAVQAHWRHMRLLSECWPRLLEARGDVASELSELLGADHDLAVLCWQLGGAEFTKLGARRRDRIVALARARQAELRHTAFARGSLLYADGSKGLGVRMARYWAISVKAASAENAASAVETAAR